MTTSAVIVAHRFHHWLERCLDSVIGQADEVVVVDNGSGGDEIVRVARVRGAQVVRLDRNLGFAGGVNVGLRHTRGDVIGLLNDDATAGPGWLEVATKVLTEPSVAVVAPKILFVQPYAEIGLDDESHFRAGDPRPLGRCIHTVTLEGKEVLPSLVGPGIYPLECGLQGTDCVDWRWTSGRSPFYVPVPEGSDPATLRINGEPAPVRRIVMLVNNSGSYLSAEGYGGDYGFLAPDDGAFDEPGERFAATGAAMVLSRIALDRLGSFPQEFFAYYEDFDWCWRARLAGLEARYDPRAVIHHVGGLTSGGPAMPSVQFLATRNRILTLARNAPLPVLSAQLRRLLASGLSSQEIRSLSTRLPRALVQRRRLACHWCQRPAEVWDQWAGVGETWPGSGAEISQ